MAVGIGHCSDTESGGVVGVRSRRSLRGAGRLGNAGQFEVGGVVDCFTSFRVGHRSRASGW